MLLPLATSAKNSWVAKFKLLVIKRVGPLTDSFFERKICFLKWKVAAFTLPELLNSPIYFPLSLYRSTAIICPTTGIWSIIGFSIDPGCQYDTTKSFHIIFLSYYLLPHRDTTSFLDTVQPLLSSEHLFHLIVQIYSTELCDIDFCHNISITLFI